MRSQLVSIALLAFGLLIAGGCQSTALSNGSVVHAQTNAPTADEAYMVTSGDQGPGVDSRGQSYLAARAITADDFQ
ncbi:MAG: hypothetical protein KIT11_05255 [Fimbriimonadaceae bacterium]|nr:hypothetical protein [Fimbriimonadaceae bacterium]QYK56700.1 MAG: hypothetical protein KF733_04265 [Fimbriimonadaceae bacterium]